MGAKDSLTLPLEPAAPFDFELTASYHSYFQARSGADNMDGGVYRRLLDLDGGPDLAGGLALAEVRSVGSVDAPALSLELRGDGLTKDHADLASGQVSLAAGNRPGPCPVLPRRQA